MYKQIIYFGAPGTGKSHIVNEKIKHVGKDNIFRVTIHPEFTYSDFVGQLLPEKSTTPGMVDFKFKKGPFTEALVQAFSDYNNEVYLVLEELSRGDVAAIFGDIFQLLDRDEYFKSKFPIHNKNIADEIIQISDDNIYLPSNFNIIATVNVNDQNVSPMDTAFKRRFDWRYISSKPVEDKHKNRLNKLNNPKIMVAIDNDRSHDLTTTWQSLYSALNLFITDKKNGLGKSEDKQIGQFFVNFKESLIDDSHSADANTAKGAAEKINDIIKNKVLLYLWQDIQGRSSFNKSSKLFSENISSFDDLYSKYGEDKIFSEKFINDFLKPNINQYPY